MKELKELLSPAIELFQGKGGDYGCHKSEAGDKKRVHFGNCIKKLFYNKTYVITKYNYNSMMVHILPWALTHVHPEE